MIGRCPYCQSPISTVTRDGWTYARCARRACESSGPTRSTPDDAIDAFVAMHTKVVEAYRCGLREGVVIAKDVARRGYPTPPQTCGDFVVDHADYDGPERLGVFWDDVDAELKRREEGR